MKALCKRMFVAAMIVCFMLAGLSSLTFAQSPQITTGLSWLSANQSQDGSWQSSSVADYQSTAEVLNTLSATGNKDASYDKAMSWLNSQTIIDTEFLARRFLLSGSSYATPDLSAMLSYQYLSGSWGGYSGYSNDILDTSLALQALKSANYADLTIINSALNYLISNQNTDGGWGNNKGYETSYESDVYTTALVLKALSLYSSTFQIQDSIQKAASYLLLKQNPDGGFGSSSTVYETALAFDALVSIGQGTALPLQNTINYLTTTQLADGSWNDDPYSTALALRALANVKPNLTITTTDISFSNTMPQTGTAVAIAANIRNTGLDSASNVAVRFFSGDPASGGTQIGADQVISFLAVGSSSQVSLSNTFTTTGSKTIFVQVDPANQISEISKADNIASARLWVATAPDLAVFSEDVKPSTFVPVSGTPFTLEYTVRNLGESAINGFDVSIYDGQPTGLPLQTAHISGLNGTEVRTGTFGVTLTGDGAHTLYVVADSGNLVTESSKTNNTANVTVTVGGVQTYADLAVTPSDITLIPSRPTAGDTVQITARIRNQGMDKAGDFLLEIYDGAPESGGVLINTQTVSSLPAAGELTITANWTITPGIHDIYVVADRANQIIETNETNNRTSTRIMPDMVDISISATDLTFNPSHPVMGDAVALTMTAHNRGIKDTGAFNLALYDGDPNSVGAPPATPLETFAIANIPGDGSTTLTYTFTASPQTYRFYAVADTENVVVEMYEENNTAIRSLKIKAPGEILGPDLVPIKIDLTGTTTDPQTLSISGTAHVTLQNKGDAKISTPFNVLIFEDKDNDGKYTQGVDTLLGTGTNTLTLWPEGANIVDVPLSGTVRFLHSPLHAMVDSGDVILEQDETNNIIRAGTDCEVRPEKPIEPVVKWRFQGPGYYPNLMAEGISGTPVVVNLTDDNNDGLINEKDIPDILFGTYQVIDRYYRGYGKIHAVRGDTGETIFTIFDNDHPISRWPFLAVGDIDNDGLPEIVVNRYCSGGCGVLVYEHDGTLKWDNQNIVEQVLKGMFPFSVTIHEAGIPVVADLDADGRPEIVSGATAINPDGSIKWGYKPNSGTGNGSWPYASIVADLDMDGKQEVIAGNTAYNHDGTIKWWNKSLPDGINAIGNLDDDPHPEIVFVTRVTPGGARIYLLEHDGNIKWGPAYLSALEGVGTYVNTPAPIIADFDGDGAAEIGFKGINKYFIINKDGNVMNTFSIPHSWDGYFTAATVFDLNSDKRPEVMINSDKYFRIFDGIDGKLLYEDRFGSAGGAFQNVIIADVDNDSHAEAVAVGYNYASMRQELRIYGSNIASGAIPWVNARRIWNQASYHVTNVNDDGTIPQYEAPSWLLNNTYRCQARLGESPNPYLAPNLTASYLRADQNWTSTYLGVRIGNGGATVSPPSVTVTFYDGNPTTGVIIGTASTTKSLQPGEYQDIIYNWTGSSIGLHHIYAVVDVANSISECRKDDNQTQLDFTIQTGLPDLKIGAEDIIIPTQITEGSIVPINVTVHNTGSVTASNVAVKLANGTGGAWIGLPQTIGAINAGDMATVAFNFDTLGHAGRNVLYVSVDPDNTIAESTKANNAASISINVQPPQIPNLVILADGIQISPVSPQEGNQVTITASITNRGSAVGNIPVRFSLGDPAAGGTTIAVPVIYPMLSLGQSAQVQAVLDSTGWAGQQTVYVSIDLQNTIAESSKSDNTASKALFIQSGGITETVLLDKPSYQANDIVTATITVANATSNTRSLLMNVSIKDSAGNLIATVSSGDAVTINPNGSVTLTRTWNTGKTLSGSYTLVAELIDAGSAIARKSANFTILADNGITAALTTDKVSYNPRESAAITSVITSQSANYIFSGLTASISIGNPAGSGQLYTDTKTITTLIPGAAYTFKTYWDTGAFAPGAYPVTLQVKDASGAVIATGTQNLTIATIQKPSALLKGQISVDKQSLLSGETVTVSYNVKNVGNLDLQNVTLSVLTVHVANQTVYDTLTYQTTISMGGLFANAGQIDTTTYTAKDYLVVLRANINGSEETLAGTYFRVEGAPTTPSLASPSNGSDVLTLTPLLTVNNASDPNDDRLTYEFELYSDIGLTQILASSGAITEAAGSTSWPVPVNLQENAAYFWRARAYDGKLYGPWMNPVSFRVNTVNDSPTAPMVSSPADNTAATALTPTLTVTNASDPDSASLTYNFDVALEPSFNQVVASGKGIFPGQGTTSWQVPLPLVENGTYYWRVQADDWFIEGPWSATAKFFVNTVNDAPSTPTIIAPLNGSEGGALSADIAVANSTDPDSLVITYFFEVDMVPTFDATTIIRSGSVTQGEGTTTWHVSGLTDNTLYYVRAKAGDGSAESPWSAPLSFFVNTANDAPTMPTMANPSNDAGVNVFTPTLSVHNATDIDRDALTYEFEVYADSAMTMLAANVTGIAETPQVTAWMVPVTLTENQTYYWRVRAFDGELYSSWTSLAKFTVNTANDAPGAPRLSSPPDGSSIDTTTPTLSLLNAVDPDSDTLTYDFEVYSGGVLVATLTGVHEGTSGITSATLNTVLIDNTLYQWRARAFDGDRYGSWTDMASFSIHIPQMNISATIDFDPDILNKKSNGTWVVAYIELPAGYKPADIDIFTVRLEGTIPAELHPSAIGDHDKDGIPDLMVKFKRSDVINLLPNGERVTVHVAGKVGITTFEGIDIISVIP